MIGEFRGKYRFLSNFWPCTVVYEGEVYPTVEHAFQAAKSLDPNERTLIRVRSSPGAAKKMGRKITLRPDWEQIKVEVMAYLIEAKFAPDSGLAHKLLATGDQNLVEGNYWGDMFWGMCDGEGENVLGRLLMDRRAVLREMED